MSELIYVANARVPSRKAHVYQILQMCDAFEHIDHNVELVVPSRRLPADTPASVDAYYDIPLDFQITRLPCIDFLWLIPSLPSVLATPIFYLQTITFTFAALFYMTISSAGLVYTRARLFGVLSAPIIGEKLVAEIHRRPSQEWVTRLVGEAFDRIRGIVVITEGLRSDWKAATETKIIVERDGVNLDRFDITAPKSDLRSELSLPPNHRIVSYVGSLQPWKGVDTLLKAAKGFPENTSACIVGGDQKERERLAAAVGEVPSNVRFVEHVPPGQVPLYLAASDVLVLPNSAEQRISAKYTSPLKLFEYMAAQRPIIASDIPSLREVLDEQMAFFVKPDDPGSLSEAVIHLAGECGADKAAVARREVERYTWKARAERITAEFGSTQANPEGEQCTS